MLVTGTTLGEPSVSARPQTVGGGSKPRSRPASQQSSSRPRTGLGAPTAKDTLAARPATTIGSSRADFSARGGKDKSNIFTPAKLSAPPSPVGVAPGPGYDSSESIMDLMHDDPEEFLLRLQHQRSRDGPVRHGSIILEAMANPDAHEEERGWMLEAGQACAMAPYPE